MYPKNQTRIISTIVRPQPRSRRSRILLVGTLAGVFALTFLLPNTTHAESKPKQRQSTKNKVPAKQKVRQTQPKKASPRHAVPQKKSVAKKTSARKTRAQQKSNTKRNTTTNRPEQQPTRQNPTNYLPTKRQREIKVDLSRTSQRQIDLEIKRKVRRNAAVDINVGQRVERKVNLETPEHRRNRGNRYRHNYHRQRHHNCHHEHWHYYDCSRFTFDFHFDGYSHYRPYYRPRVFYRPTTTVVYSTPRVVVVEPYPTRDHAYVKSRGWDLLADGQAYSALETFKTQSYRYPNASLPKVGLALARALLGQNYAAVEDLRAAFRYDPEALTYLPVSPNLERQLQLLIHQFEEARINEPRNRDWRFMLGALSYFRHDYDRAAYEISYLFESGNEVGYAVKNLNQLIYEAQYED